MLPRYLLELTGALPTCPASLLVWQDQNSGKYMDYVRKFCSPNLLKRTSSLTHITIQIHAGLWNVSVDGIKQQNMCVVEDLEHALVYNWNGDNDGPAIQMFTSSDGMKFTSFSKC